MGTSFENPATCAEVSATMAAVGGFEPHTTMHEDDQYRYPSSWGDDRDIIQYGAHPDGIDDYYPQGHDSDYPPDEPYHHSSDEWASDELLDNDGLPPAPPEPEETASTGSALARFSGPPPSQHPPPWINELREEFDKAKASNTQAEMVLHAIAAEVREIGRRQLSYERRYVFNSAIAYVIFCVLIFTGLYYVFQARMSVDSAEVEALQSKLTDSKQLHENAKIEHAKLIDSRKYANEIFNLIQQGRDEKALHRFNETGTRILNPTEGALLRQQVELLKTKLAQRTYQKGKQQFADMDYEQASKTFRASLTYQESTTYSTTLYCYLGMSLFNLKEYEGSRDYLERALRVEDGLPQSLLLKARYLHAVSTEEVGMRDEALVLYGDYLKGKGARATEFAEDVVKREFHLENELKREKARADKELQRNKNRRKEMQNTP